VRTEVKTFNIAPNQPSISIDHIFSGQLPRRCVFGFVKASAYNGNFDENPFHFTNLNIDYLVANIDGVMIPSKPFTPNFDNNLYAREYYNLYEAFNQNHCEPNLDVTFTEFKTSCTLFALNLSPDKNDGPECGYIDLIKRGNMRLDFKLKTPPTDAHVGVCYAHFDSHLEINRDGKVFLDY
jgi:hypothetical protein